MCFDHRVIGDGPAARFVKTDKCFVEEPLLGLAWGHCREEGGFSVPDNEGVVFIDGQYLPAKEGKLSVLDSGFWRGINVFDTLCAHQGYIFKIDAHLARFYCSLQAVRIAIPYTREQLREIILETVRRTGLRDSYIQCIATRGCRSPVPIDRWTPSIIVYAIPYYGVVSDDAMARGVKVRVSSIRNIPPQCLDPKIKNFNRLHAYLARLEALDSGADDPLMLDLDGYVTEGPGANIFAVRGGHLYTPTEGILLGITRQTIIEIAHTEDVPVHETLLTPYDLYIAEEVFYSTTAGGIVPIVEVDGRPVGNGSPGPITRRFGEIYSRMCVSPPHATPVYAGVAGVIQG